MAGHGELDEVAARVRARGPAPLPLDGWDDASIWGWGMKPPASCTPICGTTPRTRPCHRRYGSDPTTSTPVITSPEILAQRIALAADSSLWKVLTALLTADRQGGSDDVTGPGPGGHPELQGPSRVVRRLKRHGIFLLPMAFSFANYVAISFTMDVAFSPDGRLLATAQSGAEARLWDVASGWAVCRLSGHSDAVYGVAFSPSSAGATSTSRPGHIGGPCLPITGRPVMSVGADPARGNSQSGARRSPLRSHHLAPAPDPQSPLRRSLGAVHGGERGVEPPGEVRETVLSVSVEQGGREDVGLQP